METDNVMVYNYVHYERQTSVVSSDKVKIFVSLNTLVCSVCIKQKVGDQVISRVVGVGQASQEFV